MRSVASHSGEMSQDSERGPLHRSDVQLDASTPRSLRIPPDTAGPPRRPLDPAARASKRMYNGLSASSAGLELGISVALGALLGWWLDGKFGTKPWLMLVFLIIGVIAGFRGVLRAVARAEKADRAERAERANREEHPRG